MKTVGMQRMVQCAWRGLAISALGLAWFHAGAQTTVAGSLPGRFNVSQAGAATYHIPLQVPPGIGGLEPRLSLEYNSQSGLAAFGTGWKMQGLSYMNRCPLTRANFGTPRGVTFDDYDRYCLDGQLLILVSGSYGQDGAIYRLEKDPGTRVMSAGRAGNGPSWFKVWTKGGLVMEFGNTTDSKLEVGGVSTVNFWAVNRVQDLKGNYYTATYNKDATSKLWHYPNRINYTGNAAAPSSSVRFSYINQNVTTNRYQSGNRTQNLNRISVISTFVGETITHQYQLRYAAGKSLLAGIKQCIGDGAACTAETQFNYGQPSSLAYGTLSDLVLPANLAPINSATNQLHLGDWNGDGKTDFMLYNPTSGDNRWFLNQGNNQFTNHFNPISTSSLNYDNAVANQLHFGDWNGDGITDVMWYNPLSGKNRWFINNGSFGFSSATDPIGVGAINSGSASLAALTEVHVGDWNGDGITDFMWFNRATGDNRWFINNGALVFQSSYPVASSAMNTSNGTYNELSFGDWNGDGIVDFMWYNPTSGDNRWFTYAGTNNGLPAYGINSNPISGSLMLSSNGTRNLLHFGDWNGDGSTDVMWYNPTSGDTRWWASMGTLAATFAMQTSNAIQQGSINGNVGAMTVGDWNGDGKSDIMWYNPASGDNRWYLGNGNLGFTEVVNAIGVGALNGGGNKMHLGDWNGDGIVDLMSFHVTSGDNRWFVTPEGRDSFVQSIQSGPGNTTTIEQKPLTAASVYVKGTGSAYPVVDLQMPLHVVSRVETPNGIGGAVATNYSYGGLKADVSSGRGMQGFRWMTANNQVTGISNYTEFSQNFPYTGMVVKNEVSKPGVGNGGLLTRVVNTLECKNPQMTATFCVTAINNTYFPYVASGTEDSWDLTGAALPSITSSFAYGADVDGKIYGNPTLITVTNSDGSTKTSVNEYWPANTTGSNWILGRLKKATVTSVKP